MNRLAHILHKGIIALASNVGLYAFTAFAVMLFFSMDPFFFPRDSVLYFQRNLLMPWGLALCLLRISGLTAKGEKKIGADVLVLMLLCAWVSVPFAFRFGWAQNNWNSHLIMFLGVYAMIVEADRKTRERYLDTMTGLFAALGWVMGTTLMYCLVTAKLFTTPDGVFGYGVYQNKFLTSGHYYNTTGLIALCTALMCLCGACRAKKTAVRAVYAAPFVMMTIVVVLTQSRTSRYAMLGALALYVYGAVRAMLAGRKWLVRHAAALCAAAVMLAGGYVGADRLTDAALAHIQQVRAQGTQAAMQRMIPAAIAQEETAGQAPAAQEAPAASETTDLKRGAGDLSFTGRTTLWGNIFRFWKENPKYMFIGYGPGRAGQIISEGTEFSEMGGAQAHNTYLQFAVEYGMIGLALLLIFAALLLRPLLRLFFSDEAKVEHGVLIAIVFALLLVGLMESEPLVAMSMSNVVLVSALAHVAARSREMN